MMISEREFLERAELDHATLSVWIEEEWIAPAQRQAEPAFSEADLARARLIKDLEHGLGVNDAGLGVILHLIDQVHGLRRALAEALQRLDERRTPPEGR